MLDRKNIRTLSLKKHGLRSLGGILLISILSACSNFGMDHQVCDLRVLALQISKQSENSLTGNIQSINALKQSQQDLNLIAPNVIKKISNQNDAERLQKDIATLSSNIDVIVQNQKNLNAVYDSTLAISEVIPGIQAEYNLMVNSMVRGNYPATQVVIAKNQVFIAERILKSFSAITKVSPNEVNHMDDILSDIEIFNTYLEAQLKGSSELGVARIQDPELRESLASIQSDTHEVLVAGTDNLRKISPQIIQVSNAIKSNETKSDEVFNRLQKIE